MSRTERRLAKKNGGTENAHHIVQEMFAEALRCHQAGQQAEAERRYRQILERDPDHADSLHLLGVLAHQAGDHNQAVALIGKAIALRDDVPFFHNNRALALKAIGQIEAAIAGYERAITLKPDYAEALSNLGNLRLGQRRLEEAVACFKRALGYQPDYAEGQMNLGNALREQGKLDEAVARYERAIAIRPDYAEAHNNLGNVLRDGGRPDRAVKHYERALALHPDFAEGHNNLGNTLHEIGDLATAARHFERAVALRSDYAEAHNGLGVVLDKLGERDRAAACFERALALVPEHIEAHNNLGVVLQTSGAFDEAIAHYERALALQPDYVEARKNLGGALHARAGERSGRQLRERINAGLAGVRGQYETLPFPARDPEGERHVLYISTADILSKVNQYCFGGARDFAKGLRVLVAGCGTGDSALWLAHQLRDTPSEIVALDLSAASLDVAAARASVRGLTNIRWVNASLLDLPQLGLGAFDYISCLGVLHHLPDPEAGLQALSTVLAPDGGMALMVYGQHGRSHIYTMQQVLRQLTPTLNDREHKLSFARDLLSALPPTNAFRQREGWDNLRQGYLTDDTNLWDTLLHEQDRAYTASGVRDFLASASLNVQTFATYKASPATSALQYDIELYVTDPDERTRLAALPDALREDMAEAIDGSLALHTVYAARSPDAALDPTAPHAVLAPMSDHGRRALAHLAMPETTIPVVLRNGQSITYRPASDTRAFLAAIDGQRSNAAIARALFPGDAEQRLRSLVADLRIPTALHWLVARTETGTAWPILAMQSRFTLPLRHEEPVLLVEPA